MRLRGLALATMALLGSLLAASPTASANCHDAPPPDVALCVGPLPWPIPLGSVEAKADLPRHVEAVLRVAYGLEICTGSGSSVTCVSPVGTPTVLAENLLCTTTPVCANLG